MNRKVKVRLFGLLTCCSMLISQNGAYANPEKDMKTIVKSLNFLKNGPKGSAEIAITFDPEQESSVAHADEINAVINKGIQGSKLKITSKKIPYSDLSSMKNSVIFVTKGSEKYYSNILDITKKNKGISVSNDEACLGKGCVLVVKSEPSIDVLLSLTTAEKVGASFATAFSMMITKK